MTVDRRLFFVLTAAAVLWGGGYAVSQWWVTDDAFISFRYARNLVEGLGLVFNEGERVEGYSNFLWTMWAAVGLKLGVAAEMWSNVWGIVLYLTSIVALAWNHARVRAAEGKPGPGVPLAALIAAAHPDWAVFATGGLETSAFTFLLLAAVLMVSWARDRPVLVAVAGVVLGLAGLTRPDGVVAALAVGLTIVAIGPRKIRDGAVLTAGFAIVWVPFVLWRMSYYGDFYPNTYYAKSAWLPWYEQGWCYLRLYLERYGALFVVPVVGWLAGRGGENSDRGSIVFRQVAFAAAVSVLYTLYVVRVGGDFMFARFLIPITPLLALLCEHACARLAMRSARAGVVVAVVTVATILWLPTPVTAENWRCGVTDERAFYASDRIERLDHVADVMREKLHDLPVRVAFIGTEARVMYRARVPVAIESMAGLTDATIARQPLAARGRPGHEKQASLEYLIGDRHVHFAISEEARYFLGMFGNIPTISIDIGEDVTLEVLHWDPEVMAALASRGVDVPDFTRMVDSYIRQIGTKSRDEVSRDYALLHRFYFDHVDDPAREAPFRRRLSTSTR